MNTEFYIAKKLSFNRDNKPVRVMTRIAVFSVALSIAVMITASSVLSGFKIQLKEKISGFNSHLRISNLDSNYSFDTPPVQNDYGFYSSIVALPEVKHIQQYAYKGGIIRASSDIQGVVLKGVGTDFDWSFFEQYMTDGEIFSVKTPAASDSVIISESLSGLLNLKTGDAFEMYFIQDPVRVRRFIIAGLYNTYFEEMDKTFVVCDIRHIRRLNRWNSNQVSGMEIMLHNPDDMDRAYEKIDAIAGYLTFDDGSRLEVTTLRNAFPEIFNWLAILDMNVLIILVIMVVVAGFNMISGLLIMLLEKISTIGILKSMGMTDFSIRRIFIYRSSLIVIRGLVYGNILGLSLCILQYYFGIVHLNPESYFFSTAPVNINPLSIILLNICSFAFITLTQIIPTMAIARISPDKTMRKE
ncbi:MAG: FtsX-like permease family protein [Prevotellaceae bacterium]|nr:FtsX-like permease family protein [Prevotellaceae bacterium]